MLKKKRMLWFKHDCIDCGFNKETGCLAIDSRSGDVREYLMLAGGGEAKTVHHMWKEKQTFPYD